MYESLKNYLKKCGSFYKLLRAFWNIIRKSIALIEAILFRLSRIFNSHNDLLSHVEFTSLDELICHVRKRLKSNFFLKLEKEFALNKFLSNEYKSAIEADADEIIKHRYRILGQIVCFYDEIDWHWDPQSGYRWPLKYYKRLLPVFNTYDTTDAKLPYELSRFNHLTILGIAYKLTGDKKYIQEFIDELESWLDSNPYPRGINWTCTMDVAIRACNLIAGFSFFKESPEISDAFLIKFIKSLNQHGNYIIHNLEMTGNHYISDIVGLVYLSICFPELIDVKRWKTFAIRELIKEMEKQVYPDGCDFEASTCYHRLVLELFFFSTLLVVVNDSEFKEENYERVCHKIFGEKYTEILYKMFEAVLYLLKPNGRMPQIGDNDNGRLHVFANREILDMRYLLALGAIFFREPKFKIREFGFCEETLWIFGEKCYSIWKDLGKNSYKNINSRSFNDAGWYVMRQNGNYCLVSCGPNGQNGNGGHAHNDKLSFELMLNGHDIIVDPGTYVYTSYPEERNKFRSTGYHNNIEFDGYEQNEISEKDLFSLPGTVKIKEAVLRERNNNIVFQGEIHYAGITHKRKITLDKQSSSWHIKDIISSPKQLKGKLLFHLSPNLTCDGSEIIIKETKEKIAAIEITESNIEKDKYDYSPEYGRKVKANCLVANISELANIHEINTYIRKIK